MPTEMCASSSLRSPFGTAPTICKCSHHCRSSRKAMPARGRSAVLVSSNFCQFPARTEIRTASLESRNNAEDVESVVTSATTARLGRRVLQPLMLITDLAT